MESTEKAEYQNGEHRKGQKYSAFSVLSILTILLDKCQTKSFEGNEHSSQSNSQVLYHQPALQLYFC